MRLSPSVPLVYKVIKKSQKMTLAIEEVFVVALCTRTDDRYYIYAGKQLLCEVQTGTGTHGQ
jgi:hypothetical protein